MSLEVWSDAEEYAPYDRVVFTFRVPRAAYITLFWVGAGGEVTVPILDLHVPANRDVSVSPEAYVVPPLGRERWVALATLKPSAFPCGGTERRQLHTLDKLLRGTYGIGRWEVLTRPARDEGARRGP